MHIQTQVGLKRINGTGPFHFVPVEDIGTPSERLGPTAFFVFYEEIMAKTELVEVGCGADCASGPLTDQAVYF